MWEWHLFCESESRLYTGFGSIVGADQLLAVIGETDSKLEKTAWYIAS